MTDYTDIKSQLTALISGVPHKVANLANAASLLYGSIDEINWAGFYLMENGKLVLGPFGGKPACIEIAVGKGVCGSAVADNETKLVPDVHEFPGHIACDPQSNSEIVIPLRRGGEIIGVLDIDSASLGRFDHHDKAELEEIAAIIENNI